MIRPRRWTADGSSMQSNSGTCWSVVAPKWIRWRCSRLPMVVQKLTRIAARTSTTKCSIPDPVRVRCVAPYNPSYRLPRRVRDTEIWCGRTDGRSQKRKPNQSALDKSQWARRRRCLKRSAVMRCRILRLPEVLERTGLSRSTLFRRMRAGEFPQSVKLGGASSRAVGWFEDEVDAWMDGLKRE